MKLKEYIKNLQNLVDENPEAANYKVVYGIDSEGNGFDTVHHTPSLGNFKDGEFDQESKNKNVVCIN